MRAHFSFPTLDKLIETEVRNCNDCQLFTPKQHKEPLVPVYIPTKAWEYVNEDYVLVLQEMCTKYPVAALMQRGTTAKATIRTINQIFTNHGRPT